MAVSTSSVLKQPLNATEAINPMNKRLKAVFCEVDGECSIESVFRNGLWIEEICSVMSHVISVVSDSGNINLGPVEAKTFILSGKNGFI